MPVNTMNPILKESRFLKWFLARELDSSLFKESCFVQWFLKRIKRISRADLISAPKVFSAAKWLLVILLFACIFFPRFYLGSLAYSRVDLRVEDFFLPVIAFLCLWGFLAEGRTCESSSIEKAFLWFLIASQISIVNGVLFRTIDKPLLSFLYFLKWAEYFFILILSVRLVQRTKDADFFIQVFFLLGLVIACYGYWEHFFPLAKAVYPNYYRIFERPPFHGDANHIGGFLVLWIGFFFGMFLKSENRFLSWFLLVSILFVFFPFLWTYSRKSYFALAGALLFSFFFRENRKKLLLLISLFILLSFLFPHRVLERLRDLGSEFTSQDPFHSSWAGNWVLWNQALWNFEKVFLFGSGLGSRHRLFYESQYVLILAETGLVGLSAFLFLCLSLARDFFYFLGHSLREMDQGVATGWLIGFVGLSVHSASCVSWSVAKIAIPFWFLTAVVSVKLKQSLTHSV
jgi:hypothetical protein